MTKIYHFTKNEHPIKEFYVVLSRDADGNEGIVSTVTSIGAMPMVFSLPRMLDQVRELLKEMSIETKRKFYIMKYTSREEIEIIDFTHS